MTDHAFDRYLSGRELYGDDFTGQRLADWFEAEREGYSEVAFGSSGPRRAYPYHALNYRHGWRHLPSVRFESVLGIGSAEGAELEPLHGQVDEVTIIEPSARLRADNVAGVTPTYVSPEVSGELPFPDDSFDLIVCFGVLHHVANVSTVVAEMARVARRGAWLLIREPVVTQGDWRERRDNLTRNERGIPLPIFRDIIRSTGWQIQQETLCVFPPSRLLRRLFGSTWNSPIVVRLDAAVCRFLKWRYRYHPTAWHHRLQPSSTFVVASFSGGSSSG